MQCTYQVNFSREDGTEDLCLHGTLMRLCYPISSGISPLCHIPSLLSLHFMPLMDCFKTLRQIRKNKKSVDIIMVTAANDRASLEEALHLGVVDYLVKPFTYDRFRIALDKYLSHLEALGDVDTLNQKNIDYILGNAHKKTDELYPKGIQEKTLQTILDEMKKSPSEWMTGDEVAERIGLTGVTVRRYLNYLAEKGILLSEIDYETGGRPCMRYKKI